MKYLILGSAGQVGEGLMEYINSIGHEVIPFDFMRNPEEDLRIHNNPLLDEAVKNADFVFFLAFDVGGARYLKKYQETYDFITNNQKLMVNTFEILKKYNKPFIFASSQMSSMTFSNYGLLKNLGEKITTTLNGRVAKFWNVYGFEKDFEKSHVITDLILKAHQNKKIELLTTGTEERQFLHVEDCSRALIEISNKFDSINKDHPLHISSFVWSSVLDIANHISVAFNGIPVIPSNIKDEVQHSVKIEPSSHIKQYWNPQINIREGINDIIRRMKEHGLLK